MARRRVLASAAVADETLALRACVKYLSRAILSSVFTSADRLLFRKILKINNNQYWRINLLRRCLIARGIAGPDWTRWVAARTGPWKVAILASLASYVAMNKQSCVVLCVEFYFKRIGNVAALESKVARFDLGFSDKCRCADCMSAATK